VGKDPVAARILHPILHPILLQILHPPILLPVLHPRLLHPLVIRGGGCGEARTGLAAGARS